MRNETSASNQPVVMRCSNCAYWQKSHMGHHQSNSGGYDATGSCFRYPPVANIVAAQAEADEADEADEEEDMDLGPYGALSEAYVWVRPKTVEQDYCGEFRPGKLPIDETWKWEETPQLTPYDTWKNKPEKE